MSPKGSSVYIPLGHNPRTCECSQCKLWRKEEYAKIDMHGYDTVVECRKCGHREYLDFANGLKNGWSECCGETMPIIKTTANIELEVGKISSHVKHAIRALNASS